ncbi:hypothetical protein [Methylobacterium durans]|uniref:Secreted protein n=1 Tax=Methylobacterium durans TaxID=2202825 RepID=A0A2U8W3S6_9HYPH|nr:hypothetical protein [Methylobacterium durans]AWN40281.1 hypothetical protein DK389_06685 [Methylobacterium durans]
MRLPLFLLALLAISVPVCAKPRAAHPQPSAETMREHAEETGAITPENAEAYSQQRAFDERMDKSSQQALGSVCSGCKERRAQAQPKVSPPKAMRHEADAESIYRGRKFDPAQARTE